MISDEDLCRQVQDGNEAALEALVHRHHRPIFAYLYRLLGNRSAAEDLTQETFARLLTRIDAYCHPRPFRPWLFTIAHNLYKDYCKNHYNRSTVLMAESATMAAPEPFDLSERIAQRAEVITAVRSLDPPLREVLVLRHYHDLKVDEIAAVLSVPPGTVKYRLFRALQKLRDLFRAQNPAEGRHQRETVNRRGRS